MHFMKVTPNFSINKHPSSFIRLKEKTGSSAVWFCLFAFHISSLSFSGDRTKQKQARKPNLAVKPSQ